MNLVYINKIGQNWKGNYVYEFLFSDVLEDIDGDGWDSYPSLGNPEPPEDSIIKKSGSLFTTLKLDLVKDSESFAMWDAVDGIVALAWENMEGYDDYPEKRLFFTFGEPLSMGEKIRIYESEIKRATRRKLMERYIDTVDEAEEMTVYNQDDFDASFDKLEKGTYGVKDKEGKIRSVTVNEDEESEKKKDDTIRTKKSHRRKDVSVNPKMKKKDLVEYINSKSSVNETPDNQGERQYFVIREMPATDKVKIFKYLESLRSSGLINMYGASPLLNWTEDDLQRWLYGMKKDPDSLRDEIEGNDDYDEDDEDRADDDITQLEEQLEDIEYLLEHKQEIRDILVRAAMTRIENRNGDPELSNVQRVFEKMASESFKMWVSTVYG